MLHLLLLFAFFLTKGVFSMQNNLENVTKCCENDTFEIIPKNNKDICHLGNKYQEMKITCKKGGFLTYFNESEVSYMLKAPDSSCLTYKNGTKLAYFCEFVPKESKLNIFQYISICFMCITILIYFYYKDLRKPLLVKCIFNSLISLTVSLLILSLEFDFRGVVCFFKAYLMYYSFMCTFFWQSIVSFHVWKISMNIKWRFNDQQTYKLYAICAFLIPSLLLLSIILIQHILHNLKIVKPDIGTISCWFYDKQALWNYFYGPLTILQLHNLLFFIWSCYNNYKKARPQNNVQSVLIFYLRLFIVAGLLWNFEIVTFVFKHLELYFFDILDIINSLQGIYIFIALCCRRSVLAQVLPKCFTKEKNDYFENT